ncbi:MAG: hypothetical protein Q8880_11650 [Bacteroidota bacterium]|nr:hypothetical protein [Bacteroidota bacterium]
MNVETDVDINPITLEEWINIVNNDNELKLLNSIEGINPITRTKIIIKEEGLASWRNCKEDCTVEFHFKQGQIFVDGYDEALISKMRTIAMKLNAKVVDLDE